MEDTIAAISTSLGVGAISIIRISGSEAIKIANKIFSVDLSMVDSHTIHYGHITDTGEVIDEVLVSVMHAPKTFTTEDVVEINCHGGISTTNKVLLLLLNNGARLAEPGEFTKRAFLNGRIDLIEAEGIIDLINAKTDAMRKLALNQVDGKVSLLIKTLRNKIRNILINIEVNIDYPEYEDILIVTKEMIITSMRDIKKEVLRILKEAENGQIIKEGIKTIIIGRPNVGKSSILNHLIDEEKAIVTDVPGTTRDIIEGNISIDGVMLNIMDTAGIRKTDDIVEQIGVSKSLKVLDEANLVILVLDNSQEINEEDLELFNKVKNKNTIVFINKSDLISKIDTSKLDGAIIMRGNTTSANGLDDLKNKIKIMFNIDQIEKSDLTYLSNARQISILNKVAELIKNIEEAIESDVPVDLIAIDLKEMWQLLGNIIGENCDESLIDELFKQFCLGK